MAKKYTITMVLWENKSHNYTTPAYPPTLHGQDRQPSLTGYQLAGKSLKTIRQSTQRGVIRHKVATQTTRPLDGASVDGAQRIS